MPTPQKDRLDPEIDALIQDPRLSNAQKIERLRDMSYDATELEVAAAEGMGDQGPSRLRSIRAALRRLGADADESDAESVDPRRGSRP